METKICSRCGKTFEKKGAFIYDVCNECKTKKTGKFKWSKYILFVIAIIIVSIIGKCTGTEA